jgi:hypothetical protein
MVAWMAATTAGPRADLTAAQKADLMAGTTAGSTAALLAAWRVMRWVVPMVGCLAVRKAASMADRMAVT